MRGGQGRPVSVYVGNVSQVTVRGPDYRLLCGSHVEPGIRRRSAVASGCEIRLRGGVVIQADGRKLMSNWVSWDTEKSQFSVPGTYILDRNGVPVRGTGIRCDHHLQPLGAPGVYSKKGVEKWTGGLSF